MTTVKDAVFDVLRRHGLTTLFCNPGSTEVALLTGLPDDLRFVLALHEGSVVGMATGWAIGRDAPALAVLHTTAGLGNAVGAIATARENRAPLVVLVGQQDRRHLALEPFLTGRLAGLAGDYPVRVDQPVRAQDVPGAVARAVHEARTHRGGPRWSWCRWTTGTRPSKGRSWPRRPGSCGPRRWWTPSWARWWSCWPGPRGRRSWRARGCATGGTR
ncbi:thiamine pyrophosphate-binding protein [Nonomuraea salmonea]|uniref:thiamine pyrophosphate-binding protein n=1 Tax=Nonomuraea salmonea TaxID=46181 RepID=UPI002FE8EE2C